MPTQNVGGVIPLAKIAEASTHTRHSDALSKINMIETNDYLRRKRLLKNSENPRTGLLHRRRRAGRIFRPPTDPLRRTQHHPAKSGTSITQLTSLPGTQCTARRHLLEDKLGGMHGIL